MAEAIRNIFNLTGLARRPHALGGLLVLLTVLAYVPAINAGYIWDDDLLLTANPHMRSLQGLGNIWLGQTAADYAPLTWTSFWIGTQLWNAAPIACHTINILLHATSAVLLWRVLTALRIPGGWFAALLFAIHPVNVASVAWVAERKNTLSAVFFFASLLAFIAAYQRPDRKLYLTSILLFLLAALSKGAVVTLPLVLVGCIFWIKRKLAWRDILTIAPFGVVSAIIACLTIRYHSDLMNYQLPVSDVASRIARAGCLPWFYLGDLVLPVGLTPMSAVWDPAPGSLVYFLSPLLILVVIGIFVWRRHSWGRPLLFISGYYLWMLFPVLGFIWIAFQQEVATADWWQYLAAPGIFAAAGAAIVALTSSTKGAVRSSLVAIPGRTGHLCRRGCRNRGPDFLRQGRCPQFTGGDDLPGDESPGRPNLAPMRHLRVHGVIFARGFSRNARALDLAEQSRSGVEGKRTARSSGQALSTGVTRKSEVCIGS